SKIVNSKHCAESEGKIVEELNVLNQELRRGCGYPLSWQEPMVRARQHCYDYLVTGKAEDDYYHLVRKYDSINSVSERTLWRGENSSFYVKKTAENFLEKAIKHPTQIDLHSDPKSRFIGARNPDTRFIEAHRLTGIQMVKYFYHGNDYSWI
ncbi:hypothetical protein, partial [Endozoicomonas numazuensis]